MVIWVSIWYVWSGYQKGLGLIQLLLDGGAHAYTPEGVNTDRSRFR